MSAFGNFFSLIIWAANAVCDMQSEYQNCLELIVILTSKYFRILLTYYLSFLVERKLMCYFVLDGTISILSSM